MLLNIFTTDSTTRGGVGSLDISDVFRNKGQDIVVGSGPSNSPLVSVFNATTGQRIGSFAPGTTFDTSGIRVRAGDQDATTGVRPLLVAPFLSPPGAFETRFDPAQFMNPDSPTG